MTEVRRITLSEISTDEFDQIVDMAKRFLAFAPHGSLIKNTTEDIVNTVKLVLESGVVFVIDVGGKAV